MPCRFLAYSFCSIFVKGSTLALVSLGFEVSFSFEKSASDISAFSLTFNWKGAHPANFFVVCLSPYVFFKIIIHFCPLFVFDVLISPFNSFLFFLQSSNFVLSPLFVNLENLVASLLNFRYSSF